MASEQVAEGAIPSAQQPPIMGEKDQQAGYDHVNVARIEATDRIIQGAKTATEKEQKMTLLQGIRLYPKAIAWSILISTCIVMEGYDVCLINNFCMLPSLAIAISQTA
jgi:SP family general alpha glucoside:H+ symporter-like MFS transporter